VWRTLILYTDTHLSVAISSGVTYSSASLSPLLPAAAAAAAVGVSWSKIALRSAAVRVLDR
jgi:hypothetical protein